MSKDIVKKAIGKSEGSVIIITGASSGIGKNLALSLVPLKPKIVIIARRERKLMQTAQLLKKQKIKVLPIVGDVRNTEDRQKVVEFTLKAFGRIDVLVNNAGIRGMAKLEEFPEELWDRDLNVNLRGAFYCTKAVAHHMKTRHYGKIINQSSSSAINGHKTGGSAYAAAKAGLLGFTRSIAGELAPFNIAVNAIAPGMINTPFSASMPMERRETVIKHCPLGRIGEPEDLVGLVLFLASDRSSYITAQTIMVDGGQRPS